MAIWNLQGQIVKAQMKHSSYLPENTGKQTVDNVQIKDQGFTEGDQVLIIHKHKQL